MKKLFTTMVLFSLSFIYFTSSLYAKPVNEETDAPNEDVISEVVEENENENETKTKTDKDKISSTNIKTQNTSISITDTGIEYQTTGAKHELVFVSINDSLDKESDKGWSGVISHSNLTDVINGEATFGYLGADITNGFWADREEIYDDAFKDDNYVKELRENCPDYRTDNSKSCRALKQLATYSTQGKRVGLGIKEQLLDLYDEYIAQMQHLSGEELEEFMDKIAQRAIEIATSTETGEVPLEAKDPLMDLFYNINTQKTTMCDDNEGFDYESGECVACEESNGYIDDNGMCNICEDGTSPIEGDDGVISCQTAPVPTEMPIIEIGGGTDVGTMEIEEDSEDVDPSVEVTVSPTPTLTEITIIPMEEDCGETSMWNEETLTCDPIVPDPTIPSDKEDNAAFFEEMKSQMGEFDIEEKIPEGQKPILLTANDMNAQLYIVNVVDYMSKDDANFSKLQSQENGTYKHEDEYGKTTIYGKAYNANGEEITDVVIQSKQYGLIRFNGNGDLVSSDSIVELYGLGTQDTYNAYGYGEVSIRQKNLQFGIEGNYKIDENKSNRSDMITVNILAVEQSSIQDAIKAIVKDAIFQMEDYNYNSFNVVNTSVENIGETTIKITMVDNKDPRTVELAENGIKATYKYQMHQIVTSSDGDIYSLIDVMKNNLYDIEVLIGAGFEVTRNGELVKVSTLNGLTYQQLLGKNSSSLTTPTLDPENIDNPTASPTELPGSNYNLVAIGDTLTKDLIDEMNENSPEYVWSSDTHDYYIPDGVLEHLEFKFTNKETGENVTLTLAEALAQGYMTPEEMKEALENQDINVQTITKSDTKPSFKIITKPLENDEEYVQNITKFWEDNAYEYAFENAETYDRTLIVTSDGLKYTLDYTLKHNVYTIEELIAGGLNCIETTKTAGITSSMAIVESKVYRDIYVNEDTTNGNMFLSAKLFTSTEQLSDLPEGITKALEEKFGNLTNYFDSGKSIILNGIVSANGKTSFATSLSTQDDVLYVNIGYAISDDSEAEDDAPMVNYVDAISFLNEDVLAKTINVENVSDIKLDTNRKEIVSSDKEDDEDTNEDENDDSNESVAIVQTSYNLRAHGDDIKGIQLYDTLEKAQAIPEEIKTQIVEKVGDLETFFGENKSFVLYGIESNTTFKPETLLEIEVTNNQIVGIIQRNTPKVDATYGQAFTYYVDMVAFENAGVVANAKVETLSEVSLSTRVIENNVDDTNNDDTTLELNEIFDENVEENVEDNVTENTNSNTETNVETNSETTN